MTFTAEHEQNWAGTYRYRASSIINPTSISALRKVVATEDKVRALGTRHSFNDVADGPGSLVTTTEIPLDLEIAPDRSSVTVGSGSRYGVVASAIEAQGLALHNMGSLPHISVAGATATGTHGSGVRNGSLATSVRALEFVQADGSLRTVRRGDPEFAGSVIHLGALGVVTRVTLDVEPSFQVRQDVYTNVPWEALADGLRPLMELGYSTSLFTDYGENVSQMWVKSRIHYDQADLEVPDELFGARRQADRGVFVSEDDNTTPMDGSVGPWLSRLPHFRLDRTPSNGAEIQAEYFVPLEDGAAAVMAVRELAGQIQPHLIVTELRAVAGDDLWLSETQGSDSLAIHFTFARHPQEVAALLPEIERALAPFSPRPHWGKVSSVPADELAERYPRLPLFRALVEEHDPTGKFASSFVDALLVRRS